MNHQIKSKMKQITLYLIVLLISFSSLLSAQIYTDTLTGSYSNGLVSNSYDAGAHRSPQNPHVVDDQELMRIGYIYPNPAHDRCNVLIQHSIDKLEVVLYNLSGHMLRRFYVNNVYAGQIIPIDLQNLHEGTYSLQIKTRDGIEIQQVQVN